MNLRKDHYRFADSRFRAPRDDEEEERKTLCRQQKSDVGSGPSRPR